MEGSDSHREVDGEVLESIENCQVLYATLDDDQNPPSLLVLDEDCEPFYMSTTLEEYLATVDDDEDVIFFDGTNTYSACRRLPSTSAAAETYTAYKRVDRKVKPVPAVFPEDAKVIHTFPENPLKSLPPLPMKPPKFKPNGRLTQKLYDEMKIK